MKPLHLFFVLAFVLFLVGFALAGVLIAIDGPSWAFVVVQVVMAWAPTMAFAIMHRKADPHTSFWHKVADRFAPSIQLRPLLASIMIPLLATAVVWVGYALVTGTTLSSHLADLSLGALLVMFVSYIIRGPLGEEMGWRGYALIELNKRQSLLKASLILGVIWAVWHLPLWFVAGYEGVNLLLYIGFFTIGLTAFSVIMAAVYQGRSGNLLYAILLHQMFNVSGGLLNLDELTTIIGSSIVYAVIALVLGLTVLHPARAGRPTG